MCKSVARPRRSSKKLILNISRFGEENTLRKWAWPMSCDSNLKSLTVVKQVNPNMGPIGQAHFYQSIHHVGMASAFNLAKICHTFVFS